VDGLRAMGAEIEVADGYIKGRAGRLRGAHIRMDLVSVTGTENLMMAAALAHGTTVLENAAREPEVINLATCINAMGGRVRGAGTSTLTIEGVERLYGVHHRVLPDRIETGSFALMAAATQSELTITECDPDHIRILLTIFEKIGVDFEEGKDWLKIKPSSSIKPYSIKTHEYPGFPTDLQPPYTVLMTQAQGSSLIHETIYDRRLLFVDMLSQMGADTIMCDPHRVVINGPSQLFNKKLTSPDLRAGIALIIASLIADGEARIDNIYQIDRGYEKLDERLRNIGVDITRS